MTVVSLPSHVHFTNNASFQNFYDLFTPSPEDKKFASILAILFTLYLLVAIVVPFLEQVKVPREIKEQVPVQLAKIILKEKQLPPPEKKVEVKEEPKKEKELEKPKEEKKKEPPKPLSPEQRRELAKTQAKTAGLAAMKDELFAMREAFDITPAAAQLKTEKADEVKVKRKLIAGAMNKQSKGLSAAKAMQVVQSDKLSTRNSQKIRLSEEEVLASNDVIVEDELTAANSGQRSEMSIRRTLEAHKSRLYARYNSALRKDPFLQGKVLFEIEIQPDGTISKASIKSSELNNPKLERQLLLVLRGITFAKENVAAMVTIWAIDFLPS
jgi:outer membrane biosynthesis protein TonB